jgi:hypothetical protein
MGPTNRSKLTNVACGSPLPVLGEGCLQEPQPLKWDDQLIVLSLARTSDRLPCYFPASYASLMVSRLVVAVLVVLSASDIASSHSGLNCALAQRDLEKFLAALPHHCVRATDCDGYYIRADSCAPAVVLARPGVPKGAEAPLLKLQAATRRACADEWSQRPACSPIPFRAECRDRRCVDALLPHHDARILPSRPVRQSAAASGTSSLQNILFGSIVMLQPKEGRCGKR